MRTNIKNHSSIIFAEDMHGICLPLSHLNINYFGHVRINENDEFACINNHAAFSEHYLTQGYYNADIHLANEKNIKNNIIWDCIERTGESRKLYEDGIQFGINHTFTIVKRDGKASNFYHFASSLPDKMMNQVYLNNLDLLEIFIDYFHDKVDHTPLLQTTYQQTFTIDNDIAEYSMQLESSSQAKRSQFITAIRDKHPALSSIIDLSPKEILCLELYATGKTAKLIAEELNLSRRTIETHLANAKEKLRTNHKSKLIEKFNLLRRRLIL